MQECLLRYGAFTTADFITQVGNLALLGPVAVCAAVWVAMRWGLLAALRFTWPILAAFVAILLLKYAVVLDGTRQAMGRALMSYTAPSGHAGLAAAIYGGIGLLAAREIGGRSGIVGRSLVAAAVLAIAASRVVLGAHGVGDVLAGLGIGATAAFHAARAGGPRSLRPRLLLVGVMAVLTVMVASGLRFESARWL